MDQCLRAHHPACGPLQGSQGSACQNATGACSREEGTRHENSSAQPSPALPSPALPTPFAEQRQGGGSKVRLEGWDGLIGSRGLLTQARAVGQLRPGVQLKATPKGMQQLLMQ